jgi:homoserine O-acetyltransferase
MDSIRNDPTWNGGEYTKQPPGFRAAEEIIFFMGSNPVRRQSQMPNLAQADAVLDQAVDKAVKEGDANDLLFAVAASRDYDPGPGLEKIQAKLLAVNSADDLINPPELGILEREITRVPHGRAVVVPASSATWGHGTHTHAAVWKSYLVELLHP